MINSTELFLNMAKNLPMQMLLSKQVHLSFLSNIALWNYYLDCLIANVYKNDLA